MATTEELLISINESKTDMKEAIEAKGITVGSAPFADYAVKINDMITTYDVVNINNTETILKPWTAPTKLSDPASMPGSASKQCKFSPDGRFLAVAVDTSPRVIIYEISGSTFTKLSDPGTLPTGTVYSCDWSSDGRFLSFGHATTPFITVYERSGTTFTKLTNPASLPANTIESHRWSPDGRFLAVANVSTSPYLIIYERTGSTLTKLADPAVLPGAFVTAVGWSPNGKLLTVGTAISPYLNTYSRSGTTFTKVTDLAAISPAPTFIKSVVYSPNGSYMIATASGGAGFSWLYSVSGTTLTLVATNPASSLKLIDCSFSADGKYFVGSTSATPFIHVWSVSGTTFTKLSDPASLPAGTTGYGSSMSPDRKFVAVTQANAPRLGLYETTGTAPSTVGKLPNTLYKAFTEV